MAEVAGVAGVAEVAEVSREARRRYLNIAGGAWLVRALSLGPVSAVTASMSSTSASAHPQERVIPAPPCP